MRQPLLRLLAINLAIGIGAAIAIVATLVYFDVHGLGALVRDSDSGILAVVLLTFGFIVTLGSVAMGVAVMLLPGKDDDDDGPGGGRAPELELEYAPLYARAGGR